MAQKKAHEVDGWLKRPDPRISIVLVYGPDRGLVSERAKTFAQSTGLPLDDPFTVIKLDAGDIERDPGRLVGEARTVPMFAARRLIWVRNGGAQKALADDVKALAAEPAADALILIEAGELRAGAPLRSAAESSPAAMALPCYADARRDLDVIIDEELTAAGMTLSPDARQLLRSGLGGDRLASRGEVQKLLLYAHGQREIGIEDVRALSGDVSKQSADDAIDFLLDGRIEDFDLAFTRQLTTPGQASTILSAAIRQFQTIELLRAAMADGRGDPAAIVASARPPIFFSRRKTVERALARWSGEALRRALARMHAAVLAARKEPALATTIVRQALIGSALEAKRQ